MKAWCFAAAAAVSVILSSSALAHGPSVGKTDPAFNNNCCGGHDCAIVPTDWVREVQSGFHLVMTLDQAKTVNPSAVLPVSALVPYIRVQPSWDGDYRACIFPKDRSNPRGGVICFWVPMLT